MPTICKTNNLGGGLRDDMLQYQIDNELAADIKAIYDEETKYYNVQVISKTAGPIGTGFRLNSAGRTIKEIKYEKRTDGRYIVFTFTDTLKPDEITCKLDAIYEELDAKKQDKLTAGKHISIDADNKISVEKLPDFPIPAAEIEDKEVMYVLTAKKNATSGEFEYKWVDANLVKYIPIED